MASTNLHEFTISMKRRVEESRETHRKKVRAAALYALQSLVFGTRVDKGRARGNWQVTEGDPAEGYDPERYDLAGRLGNIDVFAEGELAISEASGADLIWLHNGVPYITILEALDHMLAGTVSALQTWLSARPGLAR